MNELNPSKSSNNGQSLLTADAAYAQAIDHFNAERYSDSDRLCTLIIQSVPHHVDAINLLGVIAQKINRHELAVEQFKLALTIDNSKSVLYYNLGISLYTLER
jgi:Flp pilus assembly protein TadD